MKIVRQVSGMTAILIMLAGCAVPTHTTAAILKLPTCESTLALLPQPGVISELNGRILEAAPGPMQLCRYRWNNSEKKLVLIAEIELPLAPAALMHALPQLKTVIEVYGPNFRSSCPAGQGAMDLVTIRSAAGSNLTILEVQRDGCRVVIVNHDNFATSITYLHSSELDAQLDAISANLTMMNKNLPRIRLTPSTKLRDGQQVLVQVIGASPQERFRISECATADTANVAGCGGQLAAQPFIDTDAKGAGAAMFSVYAKAATKPNSTTGFQICTVQCVIMATGTTVGGETAFVYAPLTFSQ